MELNYCVDCGISIPHNQKVCSMCYGDIGYGTDGHYQRWAEEQTEPEDRDSEFIPEETNE